MNLINLNYWHYYSDFNKGFIQELLAATTIVYIDDLTLPRRHLTALRGLSMNNNIMITHSDKGSGVVIIDLTQWTKKIELLYEQISLETKNKNVDIFNKSYKKIIHWRSHFVIFSNWLSPNNPKNIWSS